MSPRPAPHVAAAFLRRADEVVLVRQAAPGEQPFWSLPGGVLEDGELVPGVPVDEAAERLGRTPWLTVAASYLRGEIEPGSHRFERWRADGRSEPVDP